MSILHLKRIILMAVAGFAVLPAFSQASGPDAVREKFVQYQLHHFQEKLYVHVAKDFYLAGETIWFKVYAVDGYFHGPLSLSRLVYVEILGHDQRPVLQAKIEMKEGMGWGSFSIPVSMGSGHYRLRAYSSWMKNFNPDYYFEEPLTIVNTLRETASTQPMTSVAYDIRFFPEGGNLVDGLSSVVAFAASDRVGRGMDCRGVIVNQKMDTVARFQSLHAGMGRFTLLAHNGDQYTALVRMGDSLYRAALPQVYPQGAVMQLTDGSHGKLKITVRSHSANDNQQLFLLVHTRQIIKNSQLARSDASGEVSFYVDRDSLEDGVSVFTVFNNARQPLCERLYCKKPSKNLAIAINTNQAVYHTRNRVDLDLVAKDQSGVPVQANLSMSVFLLDSLQPMPQEDIRSYLLLTSELRGYIESPGYYFNHDGPEATEALDNLMLTQGWRRFKWEDVFNDQHPYFEFLPETEGPVVNGRITHKQTGQVGRNIMAYLSVPAKKYGFAVAVSDSSGMVHFNPEMIYGNSELIASLNNRFDSNYTIDVFPSYSDRFSSTPLPDFSFPGRWSRQLLDRSIHMQVENTYVLDKKHHLLPAVETDSTAFYGYPDKKYYLDDYTRFKSMEEVMHEYVSDVHVRKESDRYYFRVNNMLMKEFFNSDPLVLLDGVPIFNMNRIMEFDPLKIRKIEVVSGNFYQGSLANTGIVSYQTYEGDLAGFELDPGSIVVEYDGIQRQREFYAPAYDNDTHRQSPIPDFRNLLHWAPDIRTGQNGKTSLSFYSSDLAGHFVVIVQGLTAAGTAGSAFAEFTVDQQ